MAASIWKGHIAFGMVSFPVRLCAAARSQTISFNQLHKCDHSRVKQVLYCQAEDKPVSRSELVKGFEYEKDRYVIVEESEIEPAAPHSARVMEVLEFVKTAEIDPLYLDASYYVIPEAAGERPYTLLFETLRRAGYVSIAQLTMHSREHIVILRPGRFGLLLHTMYYHDEVRALDEFRTDTTQIAVRELELAQLLVEAQTAAFEPVKYRDTFRANLRALLNAKIRGEELKPRTAHPALAPVVDILEALKASLARARKPAGAAAIEAVPEAAGKRRKRAAS